MKKIIVFLIIITGIILIPLKNVKASSFYEGEYISGIWMSKIKNGTTYYQTARFFRETGSNFHAYCIEPFEMFNENSTYNATISPSNLNDNQKKRISLIAHFGYGYKNHTDLKWYAITQIMIWKEADPTGEYFFTDKLNGNHIYPYINETNEINILIQTYLKKPILSDKTYNIVENQDINLYDTNNVLNNYKTINNYLSIDNNTLHTKNIKEGIYNILLLRNDNYYNKPSIFFESSGTQNLMETGDFETIISLKIIVKKTKITLTKIDSITKTTTPSGEGQLSGAIYGLYDSNDNLINELTINNNMKSNIENINYGNYYLKEIKSGIGYQLDEQKYKILLNEENTQIDLNLENKIIEQNIELIKLFGNKNNINPESNITFNIYDKNNKLIKTIITDNTGTANFTLPYGQYIIKQQNTTTGYSLSQDLKIEVKDLEGKTYKLYDYKIKVPNTKINDNSHYYIIFIISIFFISLFYDKKKYNN